MNHYLQEIRDGVEVPPPGYPLPEGFVIPDTSSSVGADRAMVAAACGDATSKSSKQKPAGPRRLVEWCCGPSSKLGKPRIAKDCQVTRITEVDNATTREAAATAAHEVTLGGSHALLWGSMPCTGGTSWTHVNKMFPSALKKILRHQSTFKRMWKQWELVAESTRAAGGKIALELPSNCIY